MTHSPSMTEDKHAVMLAGGGCVVPGRGGGGEEVVVPAADGGKVERDSVVPSEGGLVIVELVVPVVNITGPVVMKSSHPGGSLGVQSGGLGLVLPVSVRVLFVLPVLPGPILVLPVSVRVLFVLPVLPGPVLVLPVSVRVLFVLPVLPGPVLVLPVSVRVLFVRPVLPPGPSVRVLFVRPVLSVSVRSVRLLGPVLLRPRVRVLSFVGHSVTGGQVQS